MELGTALTDEDLDELDDRSLGVVLCFVGHGEKFRVRLRRDAATDVRKHLARFVLSADGRKVSGRVGEKPNAGDEEDRRNTLEGEEEPPANRRQSIVDEGESEGDPVRQRNADCGR